MDNLRTRFIPVPKAWHNLQAHPLADLVDFGAGIDMAKLVAHMREHGYDHNEPVVIWEGMILDGRHRHAAAIEAEVVPSFKLFEGKNAFAFVVKKILRQHLNDTQRAILAAKWAQMPRGGDRGNQHTGGKPAAAGLPTQSQAAAALNVSEDAVGRAKKVEAKATPLLQQAVKDGVVSLSKAAEVCEQPAAEQNHVAHQARKPPPSRKTAPRPKKSGSVLFDWKAFDEVWGKLYRQVDVLGNAFNIKESVECEALRKALRDWKVSFQVTEKGARET